MHRSRIVLAVLAAAVLTTASSVASRAASFPNVPPGVAPEQWHPISDNLGIAVHDDKYSGRSELYGTFMVREGGTWRRVTIAPGPPGMVPAR